jgi:hypothetical protein
MPSAPSARRYPVGHGRDIRLVGKHLFREYPMHLRVGVDRIDHGKAARPGGADCLAQARLVGGIGVTIDDDALDIHDEESVLGHRHPSVAAEVSHQLITW